MTAPASVSSKANLPTHYLDGIRGLASLWVLVAHCMIWGGWYFRYLPSPKFAVDVFMVLSGYLMVFTWRDGTRDFYVRRVFRIVPVYYCALLCVFFLSGALAAGRAYLLSRNPAIPASIYGLYNPALDWKSWLLHATFLFGLLPNYSASIGLPDWSLSLEMQFYLAFPLLVPCLKRSGNLLALVFVTVVLREFSFRYLHWREPSLLTHNLTLFLIGMLVCSAAAAWRREASAEPPRESVTLWQPASIFHLGLCLLLIATLKYPPQINIILSVAAMMLTAANVPAVSVWMNRLLGNRLTRFAGDCSYAVYLFHGLAINLLGPQVYRWADQAGVQASYRVGILLLLVLAVTYPLAWLIHMGIELPFIRMGKAVAGNLTLAPATVVRSP